MSKNAVKNLDLYAAPAGRVQLFGKEHDVLQMDGFGYRTVREYQADEQSDVLWPLAARLIPTLTPDEVDKLTAVQVGAILAVAQTPITAIEDQFPNSDRPADESRPAEA